MAASLQPNRRHRPCWRPTAMFSSAIFFVAISLLSNIAFARHQRMTDSVPCVERSKAYRLPDGCRCRVDTRDNGTEVDCDGVVFVGDFPLLPFRHRIHSFRQRGVGHQTLAAQIFTASDVPLKRVDFSDNELARLSERIFDGVEDTLEEILLAGNKLGDQLNPIFSTNELRNLKRLKYLDLSRNMIKGIEDGILTGCHNLHTLELEGNDLRRIPTGALKGPKALKSLNMALNRLDILPQDSLKEQPLLEKLNLTGNTIAIIQPSALMNLKNLKKLDLSGNHLSKIPGGSFEGLENLEELDLSNNFLSAIPVEALKPLKNLKKLILHSNRINEVEEADIQELSKQLEYLDLARNGLEKIPPRTFSPLPALKVLKLNINAIRKVEDDSFKGLDQLTEIDLSDNTILLLPTSALGRLVSLSKLTMDYNRIGVISAETLASVKNVEHLSLAYNLIRDVPDGTFKEFSKLKKLDLKGNQIEVITQDTLSGLEKTLTEADFSFNALNSVSKMSFPRLNYLDLSRNNISRLQEEAFGVLTSLKYLNLSDNNLERIHAKAFRQPGDQGPLALEVLDLSKNVIRDVQPGSFESSTLMALDLHSNMLKEITTGVFVDMPELRFLDLSANDIYSMKPGSFDKLPKLEVLKLDKNNLASFKEESFTGVSNLQEISLNGNQITYLLSDAFVKHPKLRKLELSHNRLNAFPGEIVRGIRPLEELTLAHNSLKTLDNLDFANIPNLRSLDLSHNQIGYFGEAALQNSTQIQFLDLSYNSIKELPENAFLGVGRLLLNLEGNQLTSLPPAIFDRNKLYQLQSINLARNALEKIPVDALSRQYFFLQEVDFSHNQIADIQSNANILVNIKKLDLSYNPLTAESIDYILNEPKTARDLNMAGTGITQVPILETPFLRKLNLSDNEVQALNEDMFQRPTLLEVLDVSKNKIPNLSFGLASIWPKLTDLRDVRLSYNPVNYIIKGDFAYLANLEVLEIDNLPECTKIEKGAFTGLRKVTHLTMHSYPKVGFLDTKGILAQFRAPRSVSVEVKNSVVGDDLHTAFSPRLENLELTGNQVRSVSTGAFAGISSPKIDIKIYNTTVPSLPSPAFFPVPMSSQVSFDVTDNEIASLSPQLLSTLEDKQRQIKLTGLGSNPIYCDCNTRPLKKWLLGQRAERRLSDELEQVTCQKPEQNKGKKLIEISDADLSCQGGTTTTTTSEVPFTTLSSTERSEPDIIWTVDPTQSNEKIKAAQAAKNDATRKRDKMDHLIFGILGGVIAFILVLVFIICLVRLRISDSLYPGGPLVGPLALQAAASGMHHHTLPGSKCTCIKPPPPQPFLYYPPPMTPLPPPSLGGTLPKMLPPPPPPSAHSVYGSLHRSRGGYYANPPYFVTFPNDQGVNRGCDSRESQSPYEC